MRSPSPQAVLQRALEWQVTLWSGEVRDDELTGFERWLAQDPSHAEAWAQVQQTGGRLQSLGQPGAGQALRAAGAARESASRRKLLRSLGVVAGVGAVAYAVGARPDWRSVVAAHRTGTGERREMALPDGTRLVLNTASAIDLRFTPHARDVLLRSGEVFIATAADPSMRPFTVHTDQGAVRAIGTRFTVRQLDGRSLAAVEHGAVEIRPGAAGAPALRLDAGQRAWFSAQAVERAVVSAATDSAWTRGLLIAERLRLEDFLAELGRHRPGTLRCDPAVRDLIVSGVYPLDDTELALSTLALALPVRVDRVTRYWVTVRARSL
ncbi:FecR domain-containing protein [uncultured Hydrogenophaga sp.]|uniref:FecR domain-containing protein n=1 Tax=uncultured Hydrogenophaga sp. TaxID=199683 RepID=UPI0025889A1E|nr:FecR domain-containing protein [uncultured Hydrogenophaga sp.]